MTRRISNSEVQTFLSCRRKWWLAWYRGLRKTEQNPTGPLRSGSRVHSALEVLYVPEGDEPGDPLVELARVQGEDLRAYQVACAESGLPPNDGVIKEFGKNCELEHAMIEGYLEWLEETGADAEYEVIAPEQQLSVPAERVFGEGVHVGVELIGKLDVRVRRVSDGARLLQDHKTAASLTEPLKQLPQNPQMLFYHVLEEAQAAESDEDRCVGAIYNMLKKVKRTKAAKPPFFRRELILHNDHQLASFKMQLRGVITDMLFVEQQLSLGVAGDDIQQLTYPRPSRDCSWSCEFFQVCPAFDDGSRAEDMLTDTFEERDPLDRYRFGRDNTDSPT